MLIFSWFSEIVRTFANSITKSKKVELYSDKFFKSATCLIQNQLLSIIYSSLNDYIGLFSFPITPCPKMSNGILNIDFNPHAPRFVLSVFIDLNGSDKQIQFTPTFVEIENTILEGMKTILRSISCIPLIQPLVRNREDAILVSQHLQGAISDKFWESLLLQNDDQKLFLRPEEQLIIQSIKKLKTYSNDAFKVTLEYLEMYKSYQYIFNDEIKIPITDFKNGKETFERDGDDGEDNYYAVLKPKLKSWRTTYKANKNSQIVNTKKSLIKYQTMLQTIEFS